MPTPPPPLWGTLLEEENYDPREDFYNHQKAEAEMARRRKADELKKPYTKQGSTPSSKRLKLKKKVIYTYEYSDKSSDEGKGIEIPKTMPNISILDKNIDKKDFKL